MKKISANSILNSIFILLFAVLFFTPIVFIPNFLFLFVTVKTFFFFLLIEIATILYVFLIIYFPEHRPKKNYVLYSFLAFIVIGILSSLLGTYPLYSFWSGVDRMDGLILLIHVFLFFLITISVVTEKKKLNILIWTSVLSSILVTICFYLGVAGFGILPKNTGFGSPGGLFGNDSYTSIYILFNFFLIIYLFFSTQKKNLKKILGFFAVLIFFSPFFFNINILKLSVGFNELFHNPALFLGASRGAGIALILGIILMLILFGLKNRKQIMRSISKIFLITFFAIIVSTIIMVASSGTALNKHFNEETGGLRSNYWHHAVEGFKDRPILGWGTGTFGKVNEKYYNSEIFEDTGAEMWSDKPHNKPLEVMVDNGILGLISYLSIFFFALLMLWRSSNISHQTKSIFSGMLFAYFLQNLVFFDILASYLMFAFVLSIITLLDIDIKSKKEAIVSLENKFQKKKAILLISALACIGLCSVNYFVILPFIKTGNYFKLLATPVGERCHLYDNNLKLSPFGGSYNEVYYGIFATTQYYQTYGLENIKAKKDITPYIRDIDSIIVDIKNSFGADGETFKGIHRIATLYKIREYLIKSSPDIIQKMKENASRGLILSPGNLLAYRIYAEPFFYEKNYKAALEIIEKGIIVNPKIKSLQDTRIMLARMIGDEKVVKERIKEAQIYFPGVNF